MQSMETAEAMESVAMRHGFWRTVREALAGSEQDYTEGSLGRAVLLLAVPMMLEMAMESAVRRRRRRTGSARLGRVRGGRRSA